MLTYPQSRKQKRRSRLKRPSIRRRRSSANSEERNRRVTWSGRSKLRRQRRGKDKLKTKMRTTARLRAESHLSLMSQTRIRLLRTKVVWHLTLKLPWRWKGHRSKLRLIVPL